MFNFNKLNVLRPNEVGFLSDEEKYYSFVGIRPHQGKMTFFLPKGFDNFDKSYENIKNLFFKMYRTFDKFCQNGKKYGNKFLDDSQKENTKNKNSQGAYIFTDEDNNEIVLYSKIDLIDKIFQTYQELEIESLIQELGLIEEVDYSKIENYLDKGIFLSNHAIFIENMVGYRNIVRGVPSELIELFCYIYKELAGELEKELFEQIKEISFNFSYKYLSPEQSLFSEHSFESTISILKDCLDNIHKTTAYKNYQYWDIYEAVEHFLYGSLEFDKDSNQGFWGINNFSYIWEDMCNYMVANHKEYNILYCDSTLPLNEYKNNLSKDYVWIDKNIIPNNPFYLDFDGLKRWIRPDIICKHNIKNILHTKDMLDMGVLSHTKKHTSSLALGDNMDITFTLYTKDIVDNDELIKFQMKFDAVYNFFFESIFDILHPQENQNRSLKKQKTVKPFLKQLRIKRLSSSSFIIKSIPEELFNSMLNQIYEQDNKNLSANNHVELVDWKYYPHNIFDNQDYRSNDRINTSIIKSLAYEFCLSQVINEPINNQLRIPFYDINENDVVIDGKMLDCNIGLVRMNFIKIQEIYLNG